MRNLKNKRAQLTIFVILAIAIVAILIIIFYPQISKYTNPLIQLDVDVKSCLEKNIRSSLNDTLLHGGAIKPQLYFNYNNISLNYLCYTGEWYKNCVMQSPLLKQEIETQINSQTQNKLVACINEVENKLKSRGYNVKMTGTRKVGIEIQPSKILLIPDVQMIVEKGDTKQEYSSNSLKTEINSQAYDLIMIASSIQNFEARYGDTIVETYMAYYPDIKVEKKKQSDGTKVYIITHRNTGEKLQFAIRSLSWPPGYAIQ
ncbi:hypothetical protein FJZ17_03210 [Candidatus Pacearchaeota archaeon]|nr:hypothetical protein [Candidatus Pacearchaeota archaeon]